jgi:hypothetical protein
LKALAENKSALLVAPTWNEIEAVTEKVRAALKTSGRLAGEEKEFQVFDSLVVDGSTEARCAAIPSRHGHPFSSDNAWL